MVRQRIRSNEERRKARDFREAHGESIDAYFRRTEGKPGKLRRKSGFGFEWTNK